MLPKEIRSLQHPIIKHLVQLRIDGRYRSSSGTALISGKKLIQELSKKFLFKTLLIENDYETKLTANEKFYVTKEMLKKVTGLHTPEPLAAEIFLPSPVDLRGKNWILALEGISDPGNLGTLLRTALALGWEGVFITEGSVDPFNEKAIRAAKGATFQLPLFYGSLEKLKELSLQNGAPIYVADMAGDSLELATFKPPLILLLGSESHGSSLGKPFKTLSIPMAADMESLNVAIAGAILMYHIRKSS